MGMHRRGYSLIEVLVVLSVVAMIAGVLIPAIFAMRQSSRKMLCADRLRQLGVASQSFESSHRHLPDDSWCFARMLPYLDQKAFYDQYVSSRIGQMRKASDIPFGQTRFTQLECPSSTHIDSERYQISFALNTGDWHTSSRGIARVGSTRVSFASISDGASNTVQLSERLGAIGEEPARSVARIKQTITLVDGSLVAALPRIMEASA